MRSVFALALVVFANAQAPPSMSPFPSALPPYKNTPMGGAEPVMEPVAPTAALVEPFAPPPGPMVEPVPDVVPVPPTMPTAEPMMPTSEPVMGTAEPMVSPDLSLALGAGVGVGVGVGISPEPSIAMFQLAASPDMMMYSPEPTMHGMMMMPSMEPIYVSPVPVPPVAPIVTPPVTRCPNTCRLSVGANAEFNIDSPQDVAFTGPITGPDFVTALEVGEAIVDGRPVSTYGLPTTTFGIWPIGLTNKFGVGHRTVEVRDRAKLYDRCVQVPVTRYVAGVADPRLVNSMNTTVDCVSFYLTPQQPATLPVVV